MRVAREPSVGVNDLAARGIGAEAEGGQRRLSALSHTRHRVLLRRGEILFNFPLT
jgi:hypothetical protein